VEAALLHVQADLKLLEFCEQADDLWRGRRDRRGARAT
jgi:hypothetical protein